MTEPKHMDAMSAYTAPAMLTHRTDEQIISDVIAETCLQYSIPVELIYKVSRKKEIAEARHVCMYLMYIYGKFSLSQIARLFHKDHTTVMYARDRITNLMSVEPDLKERVFHIKQKCCL